MSNLMNFTEYAGVCIAEWSQLVKPSTAALYQYRIHALNKICGDAKLDTFNTRSLQEIADLLSENFSRHSTVDFLVFLRMVLRHAMRSGLIAERQFDKIRIRAVPAHRERRCLDDAEFDTLAEYCARNPIRRGSVACMLGLFAGLRIGEIAALKWSDVNFQRNHIFVQRTRQRIYWYGANGSKTQLSDGGTKSPSGVRMIPIAGKLKCVMETIRSNFPESVFIASPLPNGTEPRQIRLHMEKTIQAAGLEKIRPHGLRHSFISRAINGGASVKAVSELAGHADAKITLDIYTHANEKSKLAAIAALECVL